MQYSTLFAAGALLLVSACAETVVIPEVPASGPVPGAEIRALVEGGPYEVNIFDGRDAGTVGEVNWDFSARTVSGSFVTADGETGTFSTPIFVQGNQLCAGADPQCHFIYPFEDGFMEVNEDGTVHAVTLPL